MISTSGTFRSSGRWFFFVYQIVGIGGDGSINIIIVHLVSLEVWRQVRDVNLDDVDVIHTHHHKMSKEAVGEEEKHII